MEKKYCIIADPDGQSWELASAIYNEICKKTDGFELNRVRIKRFKDGEVKPKIELNIRRKVCFFIHDSNKKPCEWLMELCLINQAMKNSSAEEIIDVFPYLRFSRQDRKDESRVAINAKVVADVIGKYANGVLTLDVHNPAIGGFYDIRFDNLYSFTSAIDFIRKNYPDLLQNIVIMSPDSGGASRAASFARRIGIEDVAIGYKTRKDAGEVQDLKIIGDIEGRNVLIVDDIVDSGGTLIKVCNAARKAGAKRVSAYCTHGLFTSGAENLVGLFDGFFVGDTLKQNKINGLNIIPFAPLFAEAIYRISKGESLSQLFD